MKHIDLLVISLTVLLLSSCKDVGKNSSYHEAVTFVQQDFRETKELKAETLTFDSLVMRPTAIQVYDSLLITIERGTDYFFHVYNLNTHKEINRCISKGSGPGDMTSPQFVRNDRKTVMVTDGMKKKLYEYDLKEFASSSQPHPIRETDLETFVTEPPAMLGNAMLSYAFSEECLLNVFSAEGKQEGSLLQFPPSDLGMNARESLDAYYCNYATNLSDRIVVSYCLTDLVEFFDAGGNLIKRLHGPDGFYCKLKEVHEDDMVLTRMDNCEERDAYFCPVNAGDRLLVLYNGTLVDSDEHQTSHNRLFSFSWDGELQCCYNLSDGLIRFDVDAQHHIIYGISDSPDFRIVRYFY